MLYHGGTLPILFAFQLGKYQICKSPTFARVGWKESIKRLHILLIYTLRRVEMGASTTADGKPVLPLHPRRVHQHFLSHRRPHRLLRSSEGH